MSTAETMRLSSSLEDYLEAVFEIVREKRAARAKDIAERMDVGRSSVTGALKALAERNLVNYAPYDLITLTETGENVAQQIARRHEVLKDFLVTVLSIEEKEANENACKMEHVVSENVLDRLIAFAEFVERCPRGGAQWVENFGYYCNHEHKKGDCGKCVSQVLDEVREKRVDRQQEKKQFQHSRPDKSRLKSGHKKS